MGMQDWFGNNKKEKKLQPEPIAIPETKSIEIKKVENELSVCDALRKSGFDPSWTHKDVMKMLQTPDGKHKINKVNQSVIESTKLDKLTNTDIVKCYPNYITDYTCRKLWDEIPKMETIKEGSDLGVPLQVNDSINGNCNIENISIDVKLEVEKFYGESFELLKKHKMPFTKEKMDQIKMQYLNLADIVYSKSILELKQLITFYQNRSRKQWETDLLFRKTYSIRGHQVTGTDFYIPWSIFEKNTKCFGSTSYDGSSSS